MIGSNHPLWNSYKHQFHLSFTDVKEYGNSPFRLKKGTREGTVVETLTAEQTKQLTDELEELFKLLSDLAATIVDPFEPWTNRNASALDAISFGTWVAATRCSDRCRHAISVMLAADNGIPTSEQSLLAVLAMIKGGGLDRYWTDSELFRCKGGNDTLAKKFAKALGEEKVHTCTPVLALKPNGSGIGVIAKGREQPIQADDVILAIPPSVWNTIDFQAFPELAKKLAHPPQMGSNVKFLMELDQRFWKEFASSPTLSADGPVDLTWETTEDDEEGDFVMVAFSGAKDADECAAWPEHKKEHYVAALHEVYPGISHHMRRTEFMDWPSEPWTMASYYFPRLNEVTTWGPFWKAGYEKWLHFAGEHTSYAFMGYMEGALSSGYRLAKRLAIRDGLLPG